MKEDLCSFKYFQQHHDRPGEQVKGASAIEVWASKIFFCVIQAPQYSRRLPVTEICTGTKRNLSWGMKVLSSESYEITRATCMLAPSCPPPFLGPGNRGKIAQGGFRTGSERLKGSRRRSRLFRFEVSDHMRGAYARVSQPVSHLQIRRFKWRVHGWTLAGPRATVSSTHERLTGSIRLHMQCAR